MEILYRQPERGCRNVTNIEICAILGIKNLVVHSDYDYGFFKEETFAKNKIFYLDLLHFVENYDVNILTENFNKMIDERYWVDNAQDLKELIDYVDHPLLRFLVLSI